MSVAELAMLNGRYLRLCDRLKALWTYHHFAGGVFQNLLETSLPCTIDFPSIHANLRSLSQSILAVRPAGATAEADHAEKALEAATATLLDVDDQISPSHVRRFFERLNRQENEVVEYLIRFYLFADATEADCRDKLDFLVTRLGEDYVVGRGEYAAPDPLAFRQRLIEILSCGRRIEAAQHEVVGLMLAIRSLRHDIERATTIDEMSERRLLRNARLLKHRVGELFLHPDILLAIVEMNVAAKNCFLRLYHDEETRLVADSQNLLEHGAAIERNFGDSNPELIDEIARFREVKRQFDQARADSNVKHDVVAQLKWSMNSILDHLDRGVSGDVVEPAAEIPQAFFAETQGVENVAEHFRADDPLRPYLVRIASALSMFDPTTSPQQVVDAPTTRDLRLEPWEVSAHQKLFGSASPDAEEDTEDLWSLYLRAAALRIRVDEEATILSTAGAAGVEPDRGLMARAHASLDMAKELDESFGEFLREAVYYSNPTILHQLYRSRFRLLRSFSGLWLIYDKLS